MGTDMPEDKNKTNAAADAHEHFDGESFDQNEGVTTPDHTEADPMDGLVSALHAQINEANERHGDVLANMQDRLGNLNGNVDDIRQRIPENLDGKLENIETGLENLNQRVSEIWSAESSDERPVAIAHDDDEFSKPVEELNELDMVEASSEGITEDSDFDVIAADETADFAADSAAPELQNSSDSDFAISEFEQDTLNEQAAQVEDDQPAALRSASPENAGNAPAETASAHLMQGVDTFDMVDTSLPGDPGSPWDQESADALTKLYDAPLEDNAQDEVQVMPGRTPDPELDVGSELNLADAPHDTSIDTAPTHISASSGDAVDRAWLDNKFTEIAERIEQTLVELDPEKTVAVFDERVQSMEDRVGTALQDVATRSDVEGLKELESHVSGMAATMAHTETQMQRLDSIEGTLHDVVARFTEGGGAAQFADMEGMGAGAVDPNQVAEVAAARIADHLAATGQNGDGSAIADIRNMIEGFLSEHREGNEQTSLMLDTIQQAMIRILDRLDVLEGNGVSAMPSQPQPQHETYEGVSDDAVAAAQGWADPVSGNGSDDDITLTDPATYALGSETEEEAVVEIHPRDEAVAQGVHSDTAAPADHLAGSSAAANPVAQQELSGSTVAQATVHVDPGKASPDLLSDRSESVVMPAETGTQSRDAIDKIRHNFIADAQQAKARAAQAAVAASAEQPKKSARSSVLAGMKSAKAGGEAAGGFFGSKTRRLLVGALLAVAAIQGAILLMPSSDDATSDAPAPAGVTQPVEKQSKTDVPAKLQKTTYLSPGDGFSPAVEGGVLLNDMSKAVTDARQRAAGAADLPFGLMLHQTTAKEWTEQGKPIFAQAGAVVTPVAVKPEQKIGGGQSYRVPVASTASARAKMPPITVGPTSLRMAAAKGDPSAQFEVGTRMSEGKGISQDFKQAATWFKRSASQGFAQAQYRLGTLYERGLGVSRDVNRAQMWYLRAAEQGNIRAMHNLAVLSAGQASGKPDYDRAAQWFIKAAENGLADSQFNAGVLFENGLGVSKDLIKAYKWYTLAARNGDQESLKRSQSLRSKLAIDALGEAETAVRSFNPGKVNPMVNNARLAGQDWKSRHNG